MQQRGLRRQSGLNSRGLSSVLPKRSGRRAALDRDASAAHAQMDTPRWSLPRVNEVSAKQELPDAFARKIRRNAAHSGFRVDRVWTLIRQHHDHVASVAIHLDVPRHVAHPYVAIVLMNHQS